MVSRPVGLLLTSIMLLAVLTGCVSQAPSPPPVTVTVTKEVIQTPAPTPSPTTVEVIRIRVADLAWDYQQNQVAADLKYKERILEIEGVVADIGKDLFGNSYVVLLGERSYPPYTLGNYVTTPPPFIGQARIVFKSKYYDTVVAQLRRGVNIALRGQCKGKPLTTIEIEVE